MQFLTKKIQNISHDDSRVRYEMAKFQSILVQNSMPFKTMENLIPVNSYSLRYGYSKISIQKLLLRNSRVLHYFQNFRRQREYPTKKY